MEDCAAGHSLKLGETVLVCSSGATCQYTTRLIAIGFHGKERSCNLVKSACAKPCNSIDLHLFCHGRRLAAPGTGVRHNLCFDELATTACYSFYSFSLPKIYQDIGIRFAGCTFGRAIIEPPLVIFWLFINCLGFYRRLMPS